jgi:hypothetical protein
LILASVRQVDSVQADWHAITVVYSPNCFLAHADSGMLRSASRIWLL